MSTDRLIEISLAQGGQDHLKGFCSFQQEPARIANIIHRQFPQEQLGTLKTLTDKLRGQAWCEWSDNLIEGAFIRYIRTDNHTPTLTRGGIIVDIQDDKIRLKSPATARPRFWYISLSKNILFRRITSPEWVILAALNRRPHSHPHPHPPNN